MKWITEEARVDFGIPMRSIKRRTIDTYMCLVDRRCFKRYRRKSK